MTELSERLRRLSPEQRQLLELRLRQRAAEEAAPPGEPAPAPRPRSRTGPLSFAQERVWERHQRAPHDPSCNVPVALHFRGRLDLDALERSLQDVVSRHPALRATFRVDDGQPAQQVASGTPIRLPVVDLREVPGDLRDRRRAGILEHFFSRPFDLLGAEPPWRAEVIRIDLDDHVLAMSLHHIICDHVARGRILRDLFAGYEAVAAGRAVPESEPPVDYLGFIEEQRRRLAGAEATAHRAYWKQQLAGIEPVRLRGDRPRPAEKSFKGARALYAPPGAIIRALTTLHRQQGVTLYVSLVAAFAALLHGYTGQRDIVISTNVSTRGAAAPDLPVGNFTNPMLIRCDLEGDPSYRDLLARLRPVALEGYVHKDYPAAVLARELGLDARLPPWPVGQAALVLLRHSAASLPDLDVRYMWIDTGKADGDLTIGVIDRTGVRDQVMEYPDSYSAVRHEGLDCVIEYDTDLFTAATIERFQQHFTTFLERAVKDPDLPCSELLRGLDRLAAGVDAAQS